MTLHQVLAIHNKTGLRIKHPELGGGELMTEAQLGNLPGIPAAIAVSNEWQLEARTMVLDENGFRAQIIPVLRKYIHGTKLDEAAAEISSCFFPRHA